MIEPDDVPEEPHECYIDDYTQCVLHIVHSPRRRVLVHLLHEAALEAGDEPAVLDQFELATEIAAIEDDDHPDNASRKSEKSVKVTLRRSHLPLLENNGIIHWRYDDREVITTERTEQLGLLLLGIQTGIRQSGLAAIDIDEMAEVDA